MKRATHRISDFPKRLARRALQEGVRRLPISSHVLGAPRGVIADTGDWCRSHMEQGAQFVLLAPETRPTVAPPLSLEELPEVYRLQLRAKTPPRFVACIPQGRVCHTGMAIAPGDKILGDVTYHSKISDWQDRNWPIFQTLKLPPMKRHDGAVGVLASLWSDNYYHWLFDVVPRLHLLRQGASRQSDFAVEKFVVAANKSFQSQTLDLLGVGEDQRIADTPRLHLQAQRLIVPSLPGGQGNPPRWICEFLRETLTPTARREYSRQEHAGHKSVPFPRRIYISRAGAGGRRVTNEAAVLDLLRARGFETIAIEGLSVAGQILLFSNAEAVIGPHGAAFSNLVFCRPETRVVEFFAPGWIYPVYNFISAHGDLRFGCLIGNSARPLPQNDDARRDDDIEVDLNQLKEMLRLMEL